MQLDIQFDYQAHDEAELSWIPVADCQPHPLNPRLSINEEQIERISEQIKQYGYKPEHAITVRLVNDHFEIASGHHRVEACKRAGKDKILAWVKSDMLDEEAHSLLLLDNDQSELLPLEKGKHAFDHIEEFDHKGGRGKAGGISEYARQHGLQRKNAELWLEGYKVIDKVGSNFHVLSITVLYEISKSPDPSWQPLCQHASDEEWTVSQTKGVVEKTKEISVGEGYGYDLPDIYTKASKNKGRLVNQYKELFDRINHWNDILEETITLYRWEDTGETRQEGHQILQRWIAEPFEYHPKNEIIKQIEANHPLKPQTIDDYAEGILTHIKLYAEGGERWKPQLSETEIARLETIEREELLQMRLNQYVIQGNCFDILPELPKQSFDALITDPPYGVGFDTWDKIEDPVQFTKDWVKLCLPLLKEKHHIFIFCSSELQADIEVALSDVIVTPLQSRIIWHHRNLAKGRDSTFGFIRTYDVILHYGNKDLLFDEEWSEERFDVMEFPVPQSNFDDEKEHKAQKPIELMRHLVNHCIVEGDKVLDPFAGSGTTGVAVLECGGQPKLIEEHGGDIQTIRRRIREVLEKDE